VDSLSYWRDSLGGAAWFAVHREGEIELVATADALATPAVEARTDFRETATLTPVRQCLPSRPNVPCRHPAKIILTDVRR
jgi:hypothetical protein